MIEPTRAVKITTREVHDGLGGVHTEGQIVSLPLDICEIFITRNLAVYVTEDVADKAVKNAKEDAHQRNLELLAASARARMQIFDAMPADVREAAREHGDEVINAHLHPIQPTPDAPTGRKRGRPRRQPEA